MYTSQLGQKIDKKLNFHYLDIYFSNSKKLLISP